MKQNPFLGSPAPLADPSKTYREGRRRSALERNPSSGKQNHVTLSGCGLPHLQPLARLLQRLLLGSGVGRNRVLGLRRYLWLLKRHHQRRRQPGSGFRRSPRSARLDGSSPLEGLPLESARLRSALQHRGPGWWSRTTALRGEEASQQLLRRLLLQQQLWLQLRRSKQRRRSKLARRRGRSFPPAQQEGWKDNAQRLRRPLRRSRRRHQLKAQENLGRRYRELELRLLTYRLVAALEPKRQAHRRRGRRAHWRHRDPAHRLLHWLRGGSLPERRGSGGAPRELWQRLRRSPLGQRQLRWRRGFRRWRRHGQQLKALRYLRAWLRWRERLAAEAKSKREEEEGEAPQELPSSTPANPEELRLEEEDREREAGGFSRLSQRLLRLENLLRGNPRATAPEGNPNPSGDHRHRQRRAAVLEATAALLRRPGRSQRSELARALRRWRRSLLRERSGWLLQHPLLRHPAEERVLQHLRGLRERLRQEEFEREVALAEQQRQNRGALAPSGLGHPDGQAPARSPEELRDRWATYFLPDPKNGFSYFSPLSLRAKKGLFQWNRLLDYWISGELPQEYRRRRYNPYGRAMPKPQPLSPGQQQQNRHQLLDYLQLELRLLETQLELQEDPELLLQLSRRYPLDHQGRIVYPLPFRLPPVAAGENPFFLPEEENPAAAPQPSGPGLTPGRRPSPSAPSARPRFTPGGPPEASPKKNKFTRS